MAHKILPLSFSDFLRKEEMERHEEFEDIVLKETLELEVQYFHFSTLSEDVENDKSISLNFNGLYQGVMSAEIYIELKGVSSICFNGHQLSLHNFKAFVNYLRQLSSLRTEGQELFYSSDMRHLPEVVNVSISPAQITLKGMWLAELLSFVELIIDYQEASIDVLLEGGLLPYEIDYLKTFSADRLSLFGLLCDDMDDEMLMQIAQADYGYNSEVCFEFLKQIQMAKEIPNEVPEDRQFQVGEVLALIGYGCNVKTRKDKITQVFACLVLAVGNYQYVMCTEDNEEFRLTVIFLIVSQLERPYQEAALKFFLWYITTIRAYRNDNGLVYLLMIGLMMQLGFEVGKIEPFVEGLKQSDFVRYMDMASEMKLRLENFHKVATVVKEELDRLENGRMKGNLKIIVESILKQKVR